MRQLREIGESTMPQTPAQQAALGQAATALALAITLEAAAGVVSAVAIHESGVLAGIIGAQLAQGGLAAAMGVTVGAVVVSSVAIVVVAGIVIAAVVLPTLVQSIAATHPHTPRSGGDFTPPTALDSIDPDGSITGIVSVDTVGGITVTIQNPTVPGLNLEAAIEAALGGHDVGLNPGDPGPCCPGFTTGQSIGLSPNTAATDPGGFPGEEGWVFLDGKWTLVNYANWHRDQNGLGHGYGHGDGLHAYTHHEEVSWPSTLLLFVTSALGGCMFRRRFV